MADHLSRPTIYKIKLSLSLLLSSVLLVGVATLILYEFSNDGPLYKVSLAILFRLKTFLILIIEPLHTGLYNILFNSLQNIDVLMENIDCTLSSLRKNHCDHQTVRDLLDLLDSWGPLSNILFLPFLLGYFIKKKNNRTKAATFEPIPAPEPPYHPQPPPKPEPIYKPEPPYHPQPPPKPEPIYKPEPPYHAQPTSKPEPEPKPEPERKPETSSEHKPPIDSPNVSFKVDSYFEMREGCGVTLYQDAHCPPNIPHLSMVRGPNGRENKPQSCWKDLYYSIEDAQHICCLTGWAMWTKLKLFRGDEALSIYAGTLGELLVKKANQGVRVQMMVWKENTAGIKDEGLMGNHAKETSRFFKNAKYTSDNKVLCARTPRLYTGIDAPAGTFYSHHQKSVIVDAASPNQLDGLRKLVAFVGGLDLTSGRYDTPLHELYSTLLTDHYEDFRNPNHSGGSTVGPRQPWHDIHCRVEGPVAMDVLTNFVERWATQASHKGKPPSVDENLINPDAVAYQNDKSKQWNVQLFRSITEESAKFKASTTRISTDMSIATAYIQIIWNANNFIYIENQYFLGWSIGCSLDNWNNCNYIIPAEITKKIKDKIQKRERFTVYIVIPMFPEGDPAGDPGQSILYWQKKTMQLMYKEIGKALQSYNMPPDLGTHPTDWLIFMCPGKREMEGPHLDVLRPPKPGSQSEKFRDNLRFMIYVHSKMIIVDDFYIIVGTANINERSMSGDRDTEMAVGCYQPNIIQSNLNGDVHMFRMSLWAEHLRVFDDVFKFPEKLDCVSKVKQMVWDNWKRYNYEYYKLPKEVTPQGQLLQYPLYVEDDGTMINLLGFTSFPDFPKKAKIFGTKSWNLLYRRITK